MYRLCQSRLSSKPRALPSRHVTTFRDLTENSVPNGRGRPSPDCAHGGTSRARLICREQALAALAAHAERCTICRPDRDLGRL
ncbi:DUF6233 domain-containing protein [Streptomyces sp. NPDC005279]|uniref:DUF6233 domain-containing protein n=1 Tax=Streptomyces sp. NPDC005279 TaxID=3364712 RepID=UPI0036C44F5E